MWENWEECGKKKTDPRIIFLDLDGLKGFESDRSTWSVAQEKIDEFISNIAKDKKFDDISEEDALMVKFGWDSDTVWTIYDLAKESSRYDDKAEIVLCSPWHGIKNKEKMKTLFSIYGGLGEYFSGVISPKKGQSKTDAIKEYLEKRDDLKTRSEGYPKKPRKDLLKYVVLSSEKWLEAFPGHFIHVADGNLTKNYIKLVSRIFEYGFWWDTNSIDRNRYEIEDNFKKVVFLDIDGVLNHEDSKLDKGLDIIDEFVENLAELVHTFDAEIVLTSSWRYGLVSWFCDNCSDEGCNAKSHKALTKSFSKYNLRIAGMTPMVGSGRAERALEIRTWLAGRSTVEHFVILDDEMWDWKWLETAVAYTCDRTCELLFPENPSKKQKFWRIRNKGLHRDKMEKAAEILRGKMQDISKISSSDEEE